MKALLFFLFALSLMNCPSSLLEMQGRFEAMKKVYENLEVSPLLFKCLPLNIARHDVMLTIPSLKTKTEIFLWVEEMIIDDTGFVSVEELNGKCSGIGNSPGNIFEIKGPERKLYCFSVNEANVGILGKAVQETNFTKDSAYKILKDLGIPMQLYSFTKQHNRPLSGMQ